MSYCIQTLGMDGKHRCLDVRRAVAEWVHVCHFFSSLFNNELSRGVRDMHGGDILWKFEIAQQRGSEAVCKTVQKR